MKHACQSREPTGQLRQEAVALSHVPDKAPVYLHSENMTGEARVGWARKDMAVRGMPGYMYRECDPGARTGSGGSSAVVRRSSARVPKYKRQARMTQSKRHAVGRNQTA